MKRLILIALIGIQTLFAPVFTRADDCPGVVSALTPRGYQQLTVSSTAVGFTLPTLTPIREARVIVESSAIRYRDDGVNPTASVGFPIDPKVTFLVCGTSLTKFRAIRAVGADAILNISYYSD